MLQILLCIQIQSTKLCISAGSVVDFGKGTSWPSNTTAIVNAANRGGVGGGGVDGAIHHAAGGKLLEDCKAIPLIPGKNRDRIATGGAVATGPNKYGSLYGEIVIHAVGPNYRVVEGRGHSLDDGDELLRSAYATALKASKDKGCEYVGFSLISAGIFRGRRKLQDVLQIALDGVRENVYSGLKEVHLVAYSKPEQETLVRLLSKMESKEL